MGNSKVLNWDEQVDGLGWTHIPKEYCKDSIKKNKYKMKNVKVIKKRRY